MKTQSFRQSHANTFPTFQLKRIFKGKTKFATNRNQTNP